MAQEILVNIEVRTKEAQQQVKQLSKVSDELSQSFIVNNKYRKKSAQESAYLAGEEKKLAAEQKRLNAEMQNAGKIAKVYGTNIRSAGRSTSSASAAQKQFKTQAGLNNAILLEAGRLASDASFGFTAIANNLSQIVSLGSSFVATTGSFSSAMKELGRSLLGTGGFLIGVQLLISFMPKIIKFFTQSKDAVASETEELIKNNKELDKQIARRKILGQIAGESVDAFSTDFARNIREGLNGLEATDLALDEIAERLDIAGVKNTKLIKDETIANEARLEIAFRLLDIFNEENKIKSLRKQQDEEILKAQEKNRDVNSLLIADLGQQIIRSRRDISGFNDEIARLSKRGIVLTPDEQKEDKRRRRYIRKFLDFTAKIEAARLAARTKTLTREEDLVRLRGEGEIKLLEERTKRFIEVQKQRLKDRLITDKQYKDSEIQAYAEFEEARLAISKKTDVLLNDIVLKRQQRANELDLRTFKQREANELESALTSERIEGKRARARIDLQERVVDQEIMSIERRLKAGQLEVDERAKLENELTQKQGQQAKIRMAIADAETKAKIDGLNAVADFLSASSRLAKEDSVAAKALAISAALISTYLSAQKAYESQFKPLATVDSPVRGTIAAAAAVASGLANVKAISKVNPSGTTSIPPTSTNNIQAPAFNVVGASATNQLAEAVAGQVQQPVRAFVVGAEITEQQALDRKIIETAGL